MKKRQMWTINIDRVDHEVVFVRDKLFNKHNLSVDGYEVELERNIYSNFIGIDKPIMLGDKEARFFKVGNKADVAVDGIFVDSGSEYKPFDKIQWWTWIFVVLCILIPILSLGGALPILFGFGGATLCVQTAARPSLSLTNKILLNILITVMAWVGLMMVVASLSQLY